MQVTRKNEAKILFEMYRAQNNDAFGEFECTSLTDLKPVRLVRKAKELKIIYSDGETVVHRGK